MNSNNDRVGISETKTVLVAEDNESNFLLVFTILKKDYSILWAHDGLEAIDMFKSNHPDIILMDIKMPVMDGFEATCEIRKLSPDIPVLALTAFAFDKEKEKAKDCQFNDYLVKPVDIPLLKYKIKYYLNKNK